MYHFVGGAIGPEDGYDLDELANFVCGCSIRQGVDPDDL